MAHVLMAAFVLSAQTLLQNDGTPCNPVDGGSHVLTAKMNAVLASRYRSWQVRHQCVAEATENGVDPKWGSVASGDYDGDGKIDQAVLLRLKTSASRTIVVVFLSTIGELPVLAGQGSEHLATIPRGSRGHNYDTEQDVTYRTDAIFTGDYHCCGVSMVWRNGRFIVFPSAD